MISLRPTFTRLPLLLVLLTLVGCSTPTATTTTLDPQPPAPEPLTQPTAGSRHWLGPAYWGNRLQDWRFEQGTIQCVTPQGWLPMRTVSDLTHQVDNPDATFQASVTISLDPDQAQPNKPYPADASAGLLVGVGNGEMDYRAASIVHQWQGYGAGLYIGITQQGQAFIHDNQQPWQHEPAPTTDLPQQVRLVLKGQPLDDEHYGLTLNAYNPADETLISSAQRTVSPKRIRGSVALVSHPGTRSREATPARFGFTGWAVAGDAITHNPQHANSAILGTQYTLTNQVLKMTAQLMPLGGDDPLTAELQTFNHQTGWTTAAQAPIIAPGWTATFRIENWNDTADTHYRVRYQLPDGDTAHTYTWQGTVRKDPVDKEKIVVAGLSCHHMCSHLLFQNWNGDPASEAGNWAAGMYYPHADLTDKLAYHKPDLLFFAGDQVYEGRSPSFADRQNIELDYLYKWYLFVISYRDLMKDTPTITIPDDHDVYQGNVWGQGGRKTPGRDNTGGYVHPASFVNMVHRTQVAHLPDPQDPTPIEQGISYYTSDVKWGRVSFAVFADRMFKNGCAGQGLPPSGTGRPDHYNNPQFDTADLDIDGMKLLGERQLDFLEQWAGDWQGADMKMALSQTIFANMATHHGPGLNHLIADLDSNGWPQTGRNKALQTLRKAFALHMAGDQHLATLVQHGIDAHDDAIWSFCMPAAANFYPRAWAPQITNPYQYPQEQDFLGQRLDGFKNKVTVHAVTNPGQDQGHLPKALHNGMAGYGIVVIDKPKRAYNVQCWPRYADPADPKQQYKGWPRTIQQTDNFSKPILGHLPTIQVNDADSFVVKVIHQPTGQLAYALRVQGNTFKPFVFKPGPYAVTITTPDQPNSQPQTYANLHPKP